MELPPVKEDTRDMLVSTLNRIQDIAATDDQFPKEIDYVIKTFPNIMLDLSRLLIEQAIEKARSNCEPAEALRCQLRPFVVFANLFGKSPQVTSLMYSYFENSSFQPLPINSFQVDQGNVTYLLPGFDDNTAKSILVSYLKFLSFNPKWFSTLWNWSELGRYISLHPNLELRYLACCCLSIITKPARYQHIGLLQDAIADPQALIDLQWRNSAIMDSAFRPIVEAMLERTGQFTRVHGPSETGYQFGSELLAKVTNVLLLKRVIDLEPEHCKKHKQIMESYIPVAALTSVISRISYAASINKPCLIRGATGAGKTAVLDYIAAHTHRLNPPDYVKVQVGDQIDCKSLVGSYVCTEIPGQFEWQPGPLTQAMSHGSWIVFEDIDSAPSEMAQVIHSVIENGNLSCVSSCPIKLENPHPDFKIFFTQRTKGQNQHLKLGFGFIERLCDIIDLPDLSDQDLKEILEKRYRFDSLTDTVLKLYQVAKTEILKLEKSNVTRHITLRDLFKFCDRIVKSPPKVRDGGYSNEDIDSIMIDVIDCFVAHIPRDNISNVVKTMGSVLNKPAADAEVILNRVPALQTGASAFNIGRNKMEVHKSPNEGIGTLDSRLTLAQTRQSLQIMESVAASIRHREPILLVGETGVGKTTIVQNLANMMNVKLAVINLSQQSDSSDLLGGYRPIDMRDIMRPIHERFFELFGQTFCTKENKTFMDEAEGRFISSKKCSDWIHYLKIVQFICTQDTVKNLLKEKFDKWKELLDRVRNLLTRLSKDELSPMALAFTSGTLMKAVRDGTWLLLDEINLAEPDVLQCLLLVLDSMRETNVYIHTGGNARDGSTPVNNNFRIFACMNPSTDVGKRDLPIGVRDRFTELFVDDVIEAKDLRLIVESYVGPCLSRPQIESIVNFYREIRFRSNTLSDISGISPVYSLRTLCRALVICARNACRNMERSLLESLKITFLQQLNESSVLQVLHLIAKMIFNTTNVKHITDSPIQKPIDNHSYIEVEGFWVQTGGQRQFTDESYILTKSVRSNLERLCRILCLGQRKLPILIQGETSVGKTSLIKYLAKLSGNVCYRINNHEHTDLQDYIGRYVLRENGELQFREGLLVTAMRKGYWVILDELNLAPSELLEALNRVLDDNRELYIPETGETIRAHSKFTLFATQNPPQEYAGRKLLSRAFRNRFIELHFDEIPHEELQEILQKRCSMAPQHAKKIVTVMKELQVHRRESGCFGGKNSFMTIRDLFRWGQRYLIYKLSVTSDGYFDWNHHIATEGLTLLEGRVRTIREADVVKAIIEKVFKCTIERAKTYYELPSSTAEDTRFKHIHFTNEFKKLTVQLSRALHYKEPVLLCGQTGCGKTTAVQLHAAINERELLTYNCHLNTESSDFIGNVRPAREYKETSHQTFPWHDGSLVQAMKRGSIFLMDEISLADDAVLERINSVLEPDRSVTLAELNGDEIIANEHFRFVATMNPGGDYGKKELSPALRNRFTEIYCHNTLDISQIVSIVEKSLGPALLQPKIAPSLIRVVKRFLTEFYQGQDVISIRDVLSWTGFMNKTATITVAPLSIQDVLFHGACLVYFDQFGTCGHNSMHSNATFERRDQMKANLLKLVNNKFGMQPIFNDQLLTSCKITPANDLLNYVKFGKFVIRKGPKRVEDISDFIRDAPTVRMNIEKLVRALQLDRPILLEGDPGAGKTSIVAALARLTGHELVRINLSEQTDISDLFGSDLPDTSAIDDDKPRFCWHDGPMLKAIKESGWILLDEMNLASQSVLEGLNACFDHRGEIYIPELDKTFKVDRNSTRIFACQNPYSQGAARKGLPKSFLNRFTSIYIEAHRDEDLRVILARLYPSIPSTIIAKMIEFNNQVSVNYRVQGYEFNLRDMIHWCDLMTKYVRTDDLQLTESIELYEPDRFVQFVYVDRMRSSQDKDDVYDLFEKIFGYPVYEPPYRDLKIGELSFIMSRAVLPRKMRLPPHLSDLCILKYQMPIMESVAKAIEFNKMPILVGETGVGKRSIIKILAGITGNQLNVIGANREMDTVELLGSFEQKSIQRQIVDLVDEAVKFAFALINAASIRQHTDSWSQFYQCLWLTLHITSQRDLRLSKREIMDAYRYQLAQMEKLIEFMQPLSFGQAKSKCEAWKTQVASLRKKILYHSESTYSSGNFEWIDSVLIKSLREGSWLMIENANLMNPATLDRLNSLVEPNGSLGLNEKGSGSEGVEMLEPHPNFRLILTMNPEHGELSRAMRNRGVEIYVRTRFFFEDYLMLLNQNGFVPEDKKACMTYCIMQTSYDAHEKITGERPEQDGSLLAYFGLNYIANLANQIKRGANVETILNDLLQSFYHSKGHLESENDENIRSFLASRFNEYLKTNIVDFRDSRYNWMKFKHNLASLTGGDAIPVALQRESEILTEELEPISAGLLKENEILDRFYEVVKCISIKIFLEYSSHNDFKHRRRILKFMLDTEMNDILETNLDAIEQELLPKINCILNDDKQASFQLVPPGELYVDARNSIDFYCYLQSMNIRGASAAEKLQNRWILALHRVSLLLLVEYVSKGPPEEKSLITMADEDGEPIRPQVGVAADLYDLLYGLLQFASYREYPNHLVPKMMARTFWIGYILCKLKKPYTREEQIALCNQLPMLWILTYQKIILPIITDCELADVVYNNKKISSRIKHISDFLDVTITKPSKVEKEYYYRVLNTHAATTKRSECLSREIDKFFNTLLGRYTVKSERIFNDVENVNTLIASNILWTNSVRMMSLYNASDILATMDLLDNDSPEVVIRIRQMLNDVRTIVVDRREEYDKHEKLIRDSNQYRKKLMNINRRRCALDQFAPVWQTKFMQMRLAKLHPEINAADAKYYESTIERMLVGVHGLIISPRYTRTLSKLLQVVAKRSQELRGGDVSLDEDIISSTKVARQNVDMYSAFIVDHVLENIVLDSQVVGWSKMRVNTSDLATAAPLIPEYCPILSFVSSYCLDISHLKLNSYQKTSPHLDSMLMYLWRSYALIKSNTRNQERDLGLAMNLVHLRLKLTDESNLIGEDQCGGGDKCRCIEKYNTLRSTTFEETLKTVSNRSDPEDVEVFSRGLKLIYYGLNTTLEYAPIFTLDPSLRSREKAEVYKSELAHIKADLFQRNALHYWRTGENLRLVEMSVEEAKLYPMSISALVERRDKLERSIKKLRRAFINRPKTDDGSLYFELRKEVEISISRTTTSITTLVDDLKAYLLTKKPIPRANRINFLTTKCRMLIKTIERTVARFKSNFALYSELTTNYLAGYCFILQGMRLMYSRLEQKLQLTEMGFPHSLTDRFSSEILKLFSFNDSSQTNLESVNNKRSLYPILNVICPEDRVSHMQSLMLKAALLQLNHHIVTTPSDIEKCIPMVRNIADKFHRSWLERKKYLEEQRKKQEELYQYKTSHTGLNDVSFERQEFIDICTKFPLYDHVYRDQTILAATTSVDQNNLETEAKIINLNRSVDLTMCIDVCKAHYKFMKEASLNLLGQQDGTESRNSQRTLEMKQLIRIEAEVLYSIIRKCIANLDESFDSLSIECHLLQANELIKVLRQKQPEQFQVGSLRSSIEILDEEIFDIYYNACPQEVLKFKMLLARVDDRVNFLRSQPEKGLDNQPALQQLSKLTDRINSFMITDPLMKFVTGAHTLLSQLEDWNKSINMPECRMISEAVELVELIQAWRAIEVQSWRSSLHRVKRKYIDDTLCDLWFTLHEAFNDPLRSTNQHLIDLKLVEEDFVLQVSDEGYFYQGFAVLIKNFLESATLGDYQIRLDLVFSFTIQTRFAGARKETNRSNSDEKIDYEKLTTYVFNIYQQYRGLMAAHKNVLEQEESELSTMLNTEIRIVNWQGRNLWEIKTNFRHSHQKLNKVMNRYLEVLRRPVPSRQPDETAIKSSMVTELPEDTDSSRLDSILDRVQQLIGDTRVSSRDYCKLHSLRHADQVVARQIKLSNEIQSATKTRYVDMLKSVEGTFSNNSDSIKTFYRHRVQDMTLGPKDSKESRKEKLKTCRQIYHTKKFAMQAIFKNLRDIGMSYQRGLSYPGNFVDSIILSLEPLRGMIQNQSSSVLAAASSLVDDQLIVSCNLMYRELLTNNQLLLAQQRGSDLSGDQMERIRGYALDMVIDIIVHNKNAAIVYKHLMDVQAATTRLQQLQNQCDGDRIYVYKFSRVHSTIERFNEIVGRAIAAIAKLEMIMDCFKTYSELQAYHKDSEINDSEINENDSVDGRERAILRDLINEIDEKNSLMTHDQYQHLQDHLVYARKSIAEVSSALRDKLRRTIRNHLYSDDDIHQTQQLYEKFVVTMRQLAPKNYDACRNMRKGAVLGSLKSLREEAERKLKPILRPEYLAGKVGHIELSEHPNLAKLDIRLQKLIRQTKLSTQGIYKSHEDFVGTRPVGELARRKMKPFNHIDSGAIRQMLRPAQVSKQVANCFMTLNLEESCANIKPLVTQLTPILFIYTQEVARYLNVVLSSVHLKLLTANQLIPFFTDLTLNGFGLPCKIEELDGSGQETSAGGDGEDNVGFGEGEGDTDASKKLEFESQLDELKKDDEKAKDEEGEGNKGPDTENIEAHDDGIEMSEDFEAKPEGAGEGDQDGPDHEDEGESDAEDENARNELDKEFDDVDQDEGNLEQELWDDKDEPLGEDDENDLRQAEVDQLTKPDIDEKDLMAKDAELRQTEDGSGENAEGEEKEEANVDGQPPIDTDHTEEEREEEITVDDEITPDGLMDFEDISDEEGGAEMDTRDQSKEGKGEKEEEEEIDINIDAPEITNSGDEIDVDGDEDKTEDQADESAAASTENLGSADSDVEIEIVEDSCEDVSKTGQDSHGAQGEAGSDKPEETKDEDTKEDRRATAAQTKGGEPNQKNATEAQSKDKSEQEGERAEDEDISGKRTFAERTSLDQVTLKRQKIESATPSSNKQQRKDEKVQETESVRHVEDAKESDIEVIDLASDDDEALLDDIMEPDRIDQQLQSSKPRGSDKKQGETSRQDAAGRSENQLTDDLESRQQSSYNTNFGLLKFISHGLTDKENTVDLMEQIDSILKEKADSDEHESITTDRLTSLWLECTRSTGHLVHELCQKLQIVLQPTKMSKYKGDYKSGKRLNMRKIITYIASHYRKDKIWLRRTKPCKRTYNISLAVDNSSSMAENNCRQMTYQSLALLAKSLSLIEAGSLNVVSFGKQVKCIHEFDQPYVDAIGAQWLRELKFDESSTSYWSILRHSCDSFAKQAQVSLSAHQQAGSNLNVNQLLIIISDGRNVSSESEDVKLQLRQLKSMGVLTLFVIIDDPKQNDGKSIVDIKKTITRPGMPMTLEGYMDSFPFPFYVILRQIETMPSILGEALRQWFELVSNGA